MADIVKNHLTIIGDEQEKDKFLNETKMIFSLNKLLPIPEEAPIETFLETWGCKWDVDSCALKISKRDMIEYEFNTPWSPPLKAIDSLSKNFPSLDFTIEYINQGGNFLGIYGMKDGIMLDDFFASCKDDITKEDLTKFLAKRKVKKSRFLTNELQFYLSLKN